VASNELGGQDGRGGEDGLEMHFCWWWEFSNEGKTVWQQVMRRYVKDN
jgi:hypothetical protein